MEDGGERLAGGIGPDPHTQQDQEEGAGRGEAHHVQVQAAEEEEEGSIVPVGGDGPIALVEGEGKPNLG